MKKIFWFIVCSFLSLGLFAQETLKSHEEEYFDFLSLQGLIERPTLGYRTLSDSAWNIDEDVQHIWQNNKLNTTFTLFCSENQGQNFFTKGFFHGINLKIFGPEWFNSYNSATPFGQNDGALWQGKGYNTSFTTGVRLDGYGFEATLKPYIVFSQNLPFEFVKPNYKYERNFYFMKKSFFKRFLSGILATVLVALMLPAGVFAQINLSNGCFEPSACGSLNGAVCGVAIYPGPIPLH